MLPESCHVVLRSKCSHSPTKTHRTSTTIRSRFFPCSVMFPAMPLHCHKSPGKPSRDAELWSEEDLKRIRTSRPACSSGSTPLYLSTRLAVALFQVSTARSRVPTRCPAFLQTGGASFRTRSEPTKPSGICFPEILPLDWTLYFSLFFSLSGFMSAQSGMDSPCVPLMILTTAYCSLEC